MRTLFLRAVVGCVVHGCVLVTLFPRQVGAQAASNEPGGEAPAREARSPWSLSLGLGVFLAPTYLGDNDYQLSLIPDATLSYRDRLTVSVLRGISATIAKAHGFEFGLLGRYNFGRDEDGNSPLRIAGSRNNDLVGLSTVPFTIELGGFAQYAFGRGFAIRAEAQQGAGGHRGMLASLALQYAKPFFLGGQFGFVQASGALNFADRRYASAFFDVSEDRSETSGLPAYDAHGGLLSFEVGVTSIVPIYGRLSVVIIGSYELLTGEARDAPLVQERGSPHQLNLGVLLRVRLF
ncbi:MAG: MipA/OmpV family protein [Myxococcota bacterium]